MNKTDAISVLSTKAAFGCPEARALATLLNAYLARIKNDSDLTDEQRQAVANHIKPKHQ